MPPRYAYWTILAGGLPTAFRAAEKDELLPTFHRLKERQPDAVMKFFARGKLWDSPEQALRAEAGPRGRGPEGERRGGDWRGAGTHPPRGRDWRPGGDHRDPRQPFKDAKRARNQDRRRERWEHKRDRPTRDARQDTPTGRAEQPPGRRDFRNRPPGKGGWGGPPRNKPHGDRLPTRPFRPHGEHRRERPPDRPPGPNREPRPGHEPPPEPPPRPHEPAIKPPGPPERGKRKPRS